MRSIGDIAARTGLQTSAIRYYEQIGLLPVPHRVRGQRRYTSEVLSQLAVIRMAQEAGFTLQEIHMLVAGFPEGTPAGERWREMASQKLPEVNARIDRLERMRRVLEESLACGCLSLEACAAVGWVSVPSGESTDL